MIFEFYQAALNDSLLINRFVRPNKVFFIMTFHISNKCFLNRHLVESQLLCSSLPSFLSWRRKFSFIWPEFVFNRQNSTGKKLSLKMCSIFRDEVRMVVETPNPAKTSGHVSRVAITNSREDLTSARALSPELPSPRNLDTSYRKSRSQKLTSAPEFFPTRRLSTHARKATPTRERRCISQRLFTRTSQKQRRFIATSQTKRSRR